MKKGDVVKFGRVRFRVKEISSDSNKTSDEFDQSKVKLFSNNNSIIQEISPIHQKKSSIT